LKLDLALSRIFWLNSLKEGILEASALGAVMLINHVEFNNIRRFFYFLLFNRFISVPHKHDSIKKRIKSDPTLQVFEVFSELSQLKRVSYEGIDFTFKINSLLRQKFSFEVCSSKARK